MTTNEVPERKNIPEKDKWNLEAIYDSFDAWQKAFDSTQAKIDELVSSGVRIEDILEKLKLKLPT